MVSFLTPKSSCLSFSFTYIGNETLSHIASRSILSMSPLNSTRSYSNVFYQNNTDFYRPTFPNKHFRSQYSFSTINIPSLVSNPILASFKLKNATSMQLNRIVTKSISDKSYIDQQFQDEEFDMIELMEE